MYQRIKRSCKKKMVYKRVPIAAWIQTYRKDYIVSDLVAGITVGLTVIPQAIAYANVAGLPLQVRTFILLSFQVLFKHRVNVYNFFLIYVLFLILFICSHTILSKNFLLFRSTVYIRLSWHASFTLSLDPAKTFQLGQLQLSQS